MQNSRQPTLQPGQSSARVSGASWGDNRCIRQRTATLLAHCVDENASHHQRIIHNPLLVSNVPQLARAARRVRGRHCALAPELPLRLCKMQWCPTGHGQESLQPEQKSSGAHRGGSRNDARPERRAGNRFRAGYANDATHLGRPCQQICRSLLFLGLEDLLSCGDWKTAASEAGGPCAGHWMAPQRRPCQSARR